MVKKQVLDLMFLHSPLVQLIIDPYEDKVIRANVEASEFFGMSEVALEKAKVSCLFADALPYFLVFTEETIHKGRAWSDALCLSGGQRRGENESFSVEVIGKHFQVDGSDLIHLSIQDYAEITTLRHESEANIHYRSGLGHWNRVAKVFKEFEHGNQLILEAAGEGIYGVDSKGITTFLNPAAERMLGYTAKELSGQNIHNVIHHSHSNGCAYPVESCPIYSAFRDGLVHQVEDDVFWTKSGKPIDVEYTSTPMKDEGYIVGAVVIFRDVSQKKADKKRLLSALNEVETLKNRLELENAYLQEEINSEFNHHQIVGKSPAVQKVNQQISLVAPTQATVLIHGESGTGKELIARAIHEMSNRSKRSLIRVNCAAIPADLFESEFFGHIKGSFTGASQDRHGRFELADNGTIFLDEVGEIPLALQGKLLRVLQEQQFERVGDSKTRHVDVRIIAATNCDLEAMVEQGLFREDLFFRLNVFPIESVPLRNRIEDLPLLTQHFLSRAAKQANKSDLKVPLSEMERLKAYHWPGNIRELENVIERHVILAQSNTIRFDGLLIERSFKPETTWLPRHKAVLTEEEVQVQERRRIIHALSRCHGKVSGPEGAADLLGVKPTTLASRIQKFQIDARDYKASKKPALVKAS